MPRRPLIVAATLSLSILVAVLVFPAAPLSDPTGAPLPVTLHLAFPWVNHLFAPLFDLWDGVTLLALSRLHAFLVMAVALLATWALLSSRRSPGFEWRKATWRLALGIVGLGLFILGGIRWRRPMAHLDGVPNDRWVVDLHSHTALSHDAKGLLQRDFDLEADRAWHRRGGFDAFFVTDHNLIGRPIIAEQRSAAGLLPVACPGEELSLAGAHIVVLGNLDSIPRSLYADSAPGITRLLLESGTRWHGLTLASIPEYDENHFADLPAWVASGLDGFEVSNAAPKANEQSTWSRDSVIRLAQANGKWIAGVTDQHGMGATVQAWTLIPKLRWRPRPEGAVECGELLWALANSGKEATEVVERHHLRADSRWPYVATIIAVPWEGWRAAGSAQVLSWLFWIWGCAACAVWRRRRVTA